MTQDVDFDSGTQEGGADVGEEKKLLTNNQRRVLRALRKSYEFGASARKLLGVGFTVAAIVSLFVDIQELQEILPASAKLAVDALPESIAEQIPHLGALTFAIVAGLSFWGMHGQRKGLKETNDRIAADNALLRQKKPTEPQS